MSERFQKLRALAPHLEVLRPDANARVNYELMSDSLMWSDELPPVDDWERLGVDVTCMRGVFHYRTSVMMGKPVEKYRDGWELLKSLSPNWPGFLPERQTADAERKKYFSERRAKVAADWEELDARYRRQQAEKPAATV